MDDAAFDKLGRRELALIEERLGELDPDDCEVTASDGVLTLALRDGVRVVVNTHRAARQIWMAAVASAWKFDYHEADTRWRTAGGDELRATIARVIKDRIGLDVQL
jgi:CyaY protein